MRSVKAESVPSGRRVIRRLTPIHSRETQQPCQALSFGPPLFLLLKMAESTRNKHTQRRKVTRARQARFRPTSTRTEDTTQMPSANNTQLAGHCQETRGASHMNASLPKQLHAFLAARVVHSSFLIRSTCADPAKPNHIRMTQISDRCIVSELASGWGSDRTTLRTWLNSCSMRSVLCCERQFCARRADDGRVRQC